MSTLRRRVTWMKADGSGEGQIALKDNSMIPKNTNFDSVHSPRQARACLPSPYRWPSPGTPMPLPRRQTGKFRSLLDVYDQAFWLVPHFESYVLPRMNQERVARGWKTIDSVGEQRRSRWLTSAVDLLSSHGLEEVVGVIDWLFTSCGGFIPASVTDVRRAWKRDRKVTRIQLVCDYYDDLIKIMPGQHSGAETRALAVGFGQ